MKKLTTPIGDRLGEIKTRGDFRRVIERASSESREDASSLSADNPIWDVWTMMRDMYGAQWTHGDEPNMGWIYALQDISPIQLRHGVDNLCKRDDNHWPPNAAEFHDLCLIDMDWEHKRLKYLPPTGIEDLTAKEKRIELGKSEMSKIMGMFK